MKMDEDGWRLKLYLVNLVQMNPMNTHFIVSRCFNLSSSCPYGISGAGLDLSSGLAGGPG